MAGSAGYTGSLVKWAGGGYRNTTMNTTVDNALRETNNFTGFDYTPPDPTWLKMAIGKQRDKASAQWVGQVASAVNPFLEKTRADKAAALAAEKAAAEKARLDADAAAKAAEEQKVIDAKNFAYSSPGDTANNAKIPAKRKVMASSNNALKAAGATGLVGTTNNDASVLLKILLGQ